MKRISIIIAALMAGVAFIACEEKPKNIVIPNGIYEETAHYILTTKDSVVITDTIMSTTTIIEDGMFSYPFLCTDSVWEYITNEYGMIYDSILTYPTPNFIFHTYQYCERRNGTVRMQPHIKTLPNGTIEMQHIYPRFDHRLTFETDTIFYAPMHRNGETYTFEYERVTTLINRVHHMLIPLKQ